jgi:hypothetical protein
VFADDEDGPANATARTVAATVADDADGSTTHESVVIVQNVAPTVALGGADTVLQGATYTLNLGAITDPGADSVTQYVLRWGDGGSSTYAMGGDVAHVYGAPGNYTISVDLTDEDDTFVDAGLLSLTVGTAVETLRLGDAPARQSGVGGQWAAAWSSPLVAAAHKADHANAAEAWTPVALHGVSAQTLPGGDVYQGDLGVSGQSAATSTVRQEIDGTEALRFDLDHEARVATANLARLYTNDDGGVLVEAGLLRLIDSDGEVVAEQAFRADGASGMKQVKVTSAEPFVALELMAGAYDGEQFVFGAYANADGSFGAPITTDPSGTKYGSDFMLDWIEFEVPLIGVPTDLGP